MDKDPRDFTPDDVKAAAGDRVKARLLGWDGQFADGTENEIPVRNGMQEGFLDITFVEAFGKWQFNVAGWTVDPSTIVVVTA